MEEEEREQRKIHGFGKKLGKNIGRTTLRAGKKLGMKLLSTPYGWAIIGVVLLFLIILMPIVAVFGEISSGNLNGSASVNKKDEALKQKYKDAAAGVFPGVKTDSGEELKYRLSWRMLYSVDFFSYEVNVSDQLKAGESSSMEGLPYHDLDQLAQDLAPVFDYKPSTVTITTKTKKKVEKELPNGKTKTITKTETETDKREVKLLTHVDTVKGSYSYDYETKTRTSESGNVKVTVKKKVISGIDFQQDYSRLDQILKDRVGMDAVKDMDRKMVLQLAQTAGIGRPALGFLLGQPDIIEGSFGGIDISSLPDEWLEAFQEAGKKYNVDPNILMAIAFVESSFRPHAVGPPNPSGELARGMMQFLPSTFEWIGVDGDGDGKKDIFNPIDSIFSAAKYLSYLGVADDVSQALYDYSGGSDAYAQKVMRLSRTITTGGSGRFAWPTPTSSRITSPYGVRVHPTSGKRTMHNGIDIGAACGTPVVAAADGTVSASGPASGYGQWIVINHSGGLTTVYGHMYKKDLLVDKGEKVKKGQMIARVGNNGVSTGCHLHFQVEQNRQTVNPMTFLNISF